MLTLNKFKRRLMYQQRDMSDVPMLAFRDSCIEYMNANTKQVTPEDDALHFYLVESFLAYLQREYHGDQPLDHMIESMLEKMYRNNARILYRIMVYILLISNREVRYVKNDLSDSWWPQAMKVIGSDMVDYISTLKGSSSSEAYKLFKDHEFPEDMTVGSFAQGVSYVFANGSFNGSYGGLMWATVTDSLVRFTFGKLSGSGFMDVAWALAHNTGPIFNKGIIYQKQNNAKLQMILDVQRAGMVPQLIRDGTGSSNITNPGGSLVKIVKAMYHVAQSEFGGYVDWFAVEKLGAIGVYPTEKKAQEAKHGAYNPNDVHTDDGAMWLSISPTMKVKIIDRQKVHAA